MAGVFARKQLNLLPAIDLRRDMIPMINYVYGDAWRIGAFEDIDEFFKLIFPEFTNSSGGPSLAESIGYIWRDEYRTGDIRYLINPGVLTPEPMLKVNLPDGSADGLNLQFLVDRTLASEDTHDYTMRYDEHPQYFLQRGLEFPIESVRITAVSQPKVVRYANVVPIFITRRSRLTGSNKKDFRTDQLVIPEFLELPLEDGTRLRFNLVSFAVYHPGHYIAYGKSFPSREWFCYNDETVTKPTVEEVVNELTKHAVMLFYVQVSNSVATPIPEPLKNWAIFNMVIQHMRSSLVPRITKMIRKSKKKSKSKK